MNNLNQTATIIALVSSAVLISAVVVLVVATKKPQHFSAMKNPVTWRSAVVITVISATVIVLGTGVLSGWFERHSQTELPPTPPSTPAPSPTTTPIQIPDEQPSGNLPSPSTTEIAVAYLCVLQNEGVPIVYDWGGVEDGVISVSITDLTNDGIPELIYSRIVLDRETNIGLFDILIYGFEENELSELLRIEEFEANVSAVHFSAYSLYSGGFVVQHGNSGDEGGHIQYLIYRDVYLPPDVINITYAGHIEFYKVNEAIMSLHNDYFYGWFSATMNGSIITGEQFQVEAIQLNSEIKYFLTGNFFHELAGVINISMTYDEAIAYLESWLNGMSDDTATFRYDELRGNTPGNIVNGGLAAIHDNRIFYVNLSHDFGISPIYSMYDDGTDKQRLNDDDSRYINIADNRIFYRNQSSGGRVYSMNVDGSDRRRLNDDDSANIVVVNNQIFYRNQSSGGRVYSMNTDGSDRRRLNNDNSIDLNVVDGKVYFATLHGVYTISADGGDRTRLSEGSFPERIIVVNNCIFFTADNHNIHSMNMDGSERHKLSNDMSHSFNVKQDRIFFTGWTGEPVIMTMNIDGSDQHLLFEYASEAFGVASYVMSYIQNINIIENRIFFRIVTHFFDYSIQALWSMELDGSNLHRVD